jgi:hypothetical protein
MLAKKKSKKWQVKKFSTSMAMDRKQTINAVELFAYLNALLMQFGKLNGYAFRIVHDVYDGTDEIVICMKFPQQKPEDIVIDLNSENEYGEIFNKIITYEITDKIEHKI